LAGRKFQDVFAGMDGSKSEDVEQLQGITEEEEDIAGKWAI